MTDLLKLAERCEAATGPDRELDGGICLVLGWTLQKMKGDSRAYFRKPGETLYYMRTDPPAYTASIDSAMTLVPEGWEWNVGGGSVLEGFPPSEASCWPQQQPFPIELDINVGAISPALALTATALRARAAQEASNA